MNTLFCQVMTCVAIALLLTTGCYSKKKTALLEESLDGTSSYWVSVSPDESGFDLAALQVAVDQAESLSNFYAILVVRDGKVVIERYFKGARPDELYHLRSITKNWTSALTGIAIEEKKLKGVDVHVKDYFPELLTDEKEKIQINHLLNMSSGLEWDESQEILACVENRVKEPIRYALSKPMKQPPGEMMKYNSITTHALARILEIETGRSLTELAELKILTPLGIEKYEWEKDPEGFAWGGYGLQLRARDLAKFGQLYLQKGKWEGKQIVPKDWVAKSSTKQIETGVEGGGYSNQWWYADIESYDGPMYYGLGYGGQGLVIFPDKNIVVVAFQKHNVSPSTAKQQWNSLIEKVIRPIYNAAK